MRLEMEKEKQAMRDEIAAVKAKAEAQFNEAKEVEDLTFAHLASLLSLTWAVLQELALSKRQHLEESERQVSMAVEKLNLMHR